MSVSVADGTRRRNGFRNGHFLIIDPATAVFYGVYPPNAIQLGQS